MEEHGTGFFDSWYNRLALVLCAGCLVLAILFFAVRREKTPPPVEPVKIIKKEQPVQPEEKREPAPVQEKKIEQPVLPSGEDLKAALAKCVFDSGALQEDAGEGVVETIKDIEVTSCEFIDLDGDGSQECLAVIASYMEDMVAVLEIKNDAAKGMYFRLVDYKKYFSRSLDAFCAIDNFIGDGHKEILVDFKFAGNSGRVPVYLLRFENKKLRQLWKGQGAGQKFETTVTTVFTKVDRKFVDIDNDGINEIVQKVTELCKVWGGDDSEMELPETETIWEKAYGLKDSEYDEISFKTIKKPVVEYRSAAFLILLMNKGLWDEWLDEMADPRTQGYWEQGSDIELLIIRNKLKEFAADKKSPYKQKAAEILADWDKREKKK